MSTARSGRSERPRRPQPRPRGARISVGIAIALAFACLVVGLVVGYVAHGDDAPAGLSTQTREVPIVTVTVPETP